MSSLHHELNEKSTQKEQLEEHVAELQGNIEKKKIEIIRQVQNTNLEHFMGGNKTLFLVEGVLFIVTRDFVLPSKDLF